MFTVHKLKNWKHFLQLSNDFDDQYNTRTMSAYMSLQKIAEIYSDWTPHTINKEWQRNIDTIFANTDTRYSNEMEQSEFTHLNNIVSFNNSFKQFKDIKIIHPIHIHVYPDRSVVHPGNKRIRILYHHYKELISVIVTDYTKSHENIGHKKYKFAGQNLYYEFKAEHFSDKQKRYPMYKEVNANASNFHDSSFGKKDRLNKPRVFKYKNNTVTCNSVPILTKANGKWQTILTPISKY